MNIFVTDPDPRKCAQNLDDKRVIKMILESVQILSTAVTMNGGTGIYRPTHQGHPCTKWAATCYKNWLWLFNHMCSLQTEFFELSNGKYHASYKKALSSKLIHQAYIHTDRDWETHMIK